MALGLGVLFFDLGFQVHRFWASGTRERITRSRVPGVTDRAIKFPMHGDGRVSGTRSVSK